MLFSVYYRLSNKEGVSWRASCFLPSGSYSPFKYVLYGTMWLCFPLAWLLAWPKMNPGWHLKEKRDFMDFLNILDNNKPSFSLWVARNDMRSTLHTEDEMSWDWIFSNILIFLFHLVTLKWNSIFANMFVKSWVTLSGFFEYKVCWWAK